MLVPANRTALRNILGLIKGNINAPIEKVNDSTGEAAALYEVYKYYKGQSAFPRAYSQRRTPQRRQGNNPGSSSSSTRRRHSAGSDQRFALKPNGDYLGPAANSCGRNHMIFIVNNAQGTSQRGLRPSKGSAPANRWSDRRRFRCELDGRVGALPLQERHQRPHPRRVSRAAEQVAFADPRASSARVAGGKYYSGQQPGRHQAGHRGDHGANPWRCNTTFAAASLPISATNRSQNLNQVFIGMFRPASTTAEPRWMGNLKQYQLADDSRAIDLVDVSAQNAVNLRHRLRERMRVSFWTTGSGSYWQNVYANACCTQPAARSSLRGRRT